MPKRQRPSKKSRIKYEEGSNPLSGHRVKLKAREKAFILELSRNLKKLWGKNSPKRPQNGVGVRATGVEMAAIQGGSGFLPKLVRVVAWHGWCSSGRGLSILWLLPMGGVPN